ncbi:16913_t:CDS:2, partial [Entrophospora sp. SA101]
IQGLNNSGMKLGALAYISNLESYEGSDLRSFVTIYSSTIDQDVKRESAAPIEADI